METRKNSMKLVFAPTAKVPIHLDVLRFMMRVLKIPATDVHTVYKDENDQRFYVKFMDESSFNRFSATMEDQYWFQYADGEKTRVQLEMASRQFKYVRIFNLPPETEDKDIAAVLGQFGRIRQHVRERYPTDYGYAVFSGIRGVHMEIEQEIPANLYIAHFRARVYYDGLKNRCFFCKAEGHNKSDCPKLADMKDSSTSGSVNSRLYSQVAANLRIATGHSGEGSAAASMTVLQVPLHPSSRNANQGENDSSVAEAAPAKSGGGATASVARAVANKATDEPAAKQQNSNTTQVTNTTNDEMETDGTLREGMEKAEEKADGGLKRPPPPLPSTSESDSSLVETITDPGRGRGKKKKSEEKISSRSRSNSRQSRRSSNGSSRRKGK